MSAGRRERLLAVPFEIRPVLMMYLVIPGMSIRAAPVARIGRCRGGDAAVVRRA